MNSHRIRFALLTAVAVVLLLAGFSIINPTGRAKPYTIDLIPPGFVQTAYADENSPLAGILDEAGIAGYYQTEEAITIGSALRAVFRTIEDEKPTYIVGSVPIPGFPESYDVHAYVHTDGWIMVYYLKIDPVGKIFDWNVYTDDAPSTVTVFETVAPIVAGGAGQPYTSLTFYDFRYPNANQVMLIAEDNATEGSFSVQLPASYTYYESSWSVKSYTGSNVCTWTLNNSDIGGASSGDFRTGLISAGQLLPDVTHSIVIDTFGYCEGGRALVYRVP